MRPWIDPDTEAARLDEVAARWYRREQAALAAIAATPDSAVEATWSNLIAAVITYRAAELRFRHAGLYERATEIASAIAVMRPRVIASGLQWRGWAVANAIPASVDARWDVEA